MNMSDDLSGAVVGISSQVAQKGVETAQHLVDKTIDNIAKLMQVLFTKKGDGRGKEKDIKSSDMIALKSGGVCVKELVAEAKKNGDTVISTDGYSQADMKFIEKRAGEYGIPVAFTGKENSDNICAHIRGSDKAVFERICTDMMGDKLKARPQELDNFKAERWEIEGIHRELSKHDLNANWGKTKDGEYFCLFEKADKKAVLMARGEFVRKCCEVESDLSITKGEEYGMFVIADKKTGREISFNDFPSRSELSTLFQEKFGYDENKAEIACGKFGESQLDGIAKRDYFGNNPQKEFSDIQNHVELKGENILVKDYDCLRLTPKEDGVPCLVYRDGNNNFAILKPDKMSRKDMAAALQASLGIEDEKTVNALADKAEKVNDYYFKQNLDNYSLSRNVTVGDVKDDKSVVIKSNIERIDKHQFKVDTKAYNHEFMGLNVDGAVKDSNTIPTASLVLSFSDKKTALSELREMFKAQGLSDDVAKQSAKDVFAKAQVQSAEKVLHIESIRADNNTANMTVRLGARVKEIDLNERDKTAEEIGEKFGVTEKEAETLLDKAQDKAGENVQLFKKPEVKADMPEIPEVPVSPKRR